MLALRRMRRSDSCVIATLPGTSSVNAFRIWLAQYSLRRCTLPSNVIFRASSSTPSLWLQRTVAVTTCQNLGHVRSVTLLRLDLRTPHIAPVHGQAQCTLILRQAHCALLCSFCSLVQSSFFHELSALSALDTKRIDHPSHYLSWAILTAAVAALSAAQKNDPNLDVISTSSQPTFRLFLYA
jgi:hypothetical protein